MGHHCIREVADEIVAEIENMPNSRCCGFAVRAAKDFRMDTREDLAERTEYRHTGSHGLGLVRNGNGIVVFDSATAKATILNRKSLSSGKGFYLKRTPFA